jgi:hypothetical protein
MYLNGEAIEVLHQPAAHTDSDVIAFFRRSDVVVAGDVLDTRQFPVIDIDRGGSIQGEIAVLNRLVDLAVPSVPIVTREAGTIVVPGHGRLCDQYDVVEYRDMVTIIRDRVRDLMKAGRSLAEVQAAQPAKGYMGRYGTQEAPGRQIVSSRLSTGVLPRRSFENALSRRYGCSHDGARFTDKCARATARRRRPEVCAGRSADRPHRVLGVIRDRELALSDGDACQGRVPPNSILACCSSSDQRLGSRRRRARGQPVQVVWRGEHHERARPASHRFFLDSRISAARRCASLSENCGSISSMSFSPEIMVEFTSYPFTPRPV